MTQSNLQARREALNGTAHYVQFYGGWYCINFDTGRATRAQDQLHAIKLAEAKNAETCNCPIAANNAPLAHMPTCNERVAFLAARAAS